LHALPRAAATRLMIFAANRSIRPELTGAKHAPLHALVGHSAGAGANGGPAARPRPGKPLCMYRGPSYPPPPLEGLRRRLNPPEKLLTRYQSYLAAELQVESTRSRRAKSSAVAGIDRRLCLTRKAGLSRTCRRIASRLPAKACACTRRLLTGMSACSAPPEVHYEVCKFMLGLDESRNDSAGSLTLPGRSHLHNSCAGSMGLKSYGT